MYDVVIVGGRCAGSSLALLLAQANLKVLIVDRSNLPSDKINSTHLIWHAGAACLQRWGLLDRLLATGCPLQRRFLLDLGMFQLRSNVELRDCIVDGAVAPRRDVLDGLLLEEALAVGAELRDEAHVSDLLTENGRVTGVRIRTETGGSEDIPARVTIGADGINSTIAKLASATEASAQDKQQQTYFAYFSGVAFEEVEFYSRPGRMGFIWKTNHDQVVAGLCCRLADVDALRADTVSAFWAEMEAISPDLAARLKAGRQESEIRTGGTRSFIRQASGSGWALTGDAGMNMDPISAQGISNSFLQAEMLSDAIIRGFAEGNPDEALAAFGEKRNETLGPIYAFTSEMARLDPEPPAEIIQLFMGLAKSQTDTDAYFGVFAQTVPVAEFFAPENMGRIMALAEAE